MTIFLNTSESWTLIIIANILSENTCDYFISNRYPLIIRIVTHDYFSQVLMLSFYSWLELSSFVSPIHSILAFIILLNSYQMTMLLYKSLNLTLLANLFNFSRIFEFVRGKFVYLLMNLVFHCFKYIYLFETVIGHICFHSFGKIYVFDCPFVKILLLNASRPRMNYFYTIIYIY